MNKPIKVVMLPTEDNTNLGYYTDPRDRSLYFHVQGSDKRKGFEPQHIYITVDQSVEPIKEGDWAESNGRIMKIDNAWHTFKGNSIYRKIIATTDPKLINKMPSGEMYPDWFYDVPQLQQSFIKEYVANPNGEFEVEYEHYTDGKTSILDQILKLTLNQDNTINLTLVEEKMYNKSDVKQLLNLALATGSAYGDKMDQENANSWIKENLK